MLGETLGQTKRASKKIVCQLFLGIGRRVPHPLRPFYFLAAGDQAARKYEPHVYSGHVLLFLTKNRSPDLRQILGELTTERLEVYEIPGGHLDIMREPHVRTLAAKLQACLAQAQE